MSDIILNEIIETIKHLLSITDLENEKNINIKIQISKQKDIDIEISPVSKKRKKLTVGTTYNLDHVIDIPSGDFMDYLY